MKMARDNDKRLTLFELLKHMYDNDYHGFVSFGFLVFFVIIIVATAMTITLSVKAICEYAEVDRRFDFLDKHPEILREHPEWQHEYLDLGKKKLPSP